MTRIAFSVFKTGCISRLVINGRNVDLRKEALQSVNLVSCENCAENNPCLNNGVCQEVPSMTGFTCICIPGYSGERCHLTKDVCYAGTDT